MKTASLATLDYASKYKNALLYNRYLSGRDRSRKGRTEAPYAYVVPQDQRDPVAAVEMLRRLAFSGVRVSQLTAPVDDRGHDASRRHLGRARPIRSSPRSRAKCSTCRSTRRSASHRTARSTRPTTRPAGRCRCDGRPDDRGDHAAHRRDPIEDAAARAPAGAGRADCAVQHVARRPTPRRSTAHPASASTAIRWRARSCRRPAGSPARGPALAVNPAENNAFKAINRAWRAGASVAYHAGSGGRRRRPVRDLRPVGVGADPISSSRSRSVPSMPTRPPSRRPQRPRIGLLLANTSMDEGWTRWVLDQFEFEYSRISGADIQAGSLRDKIDVLVLADDARVLEGGGGRGGRGAGGPPAAAGARVPAAHSGRLEAEARRRPRT